MARKKLFKRGGLKGRVKGLKGKVKNIKIGKGALKNRLNNAIASKGYAILAPYKQLMRRILAKRGHPISNNESIKNVSLLFYAVAVKGRLHFEYHNFTKLSRTFHLEPEEAQVVAQIAGDTDTKDSIQQILDFLGRALHVKERGESLTPEQAIVVEEVEKVEEEGKGLSLNTEEQDEEEGGFFARFFRKLFGKKKKKENFRRRIDARNKPAKKFKSKVSKITPYATPSGFGSGVSTMGGSLGGSKVAPMGLSTSGVAPTSNTVVSSYEYTQNYANKVAHIAGQQGTLRPLIPNTNLSNTGSPVLNQLMYGRVKKYRDKDLPGMINVNGRWYRDL